MKKITCAVVMAMAFFTFLMPSALSADHYTSAMRETSRNASGDWGPASEMRAFGIFRHIFINYDELVHICLLAGDIPAPDLISACAEPARALQAAAYDVQVNPIYSPNYSAQELAHLDRIISLARDVETSCRQGESYFREFLNEIGYNFTESTIRILYGDNPGLNTAIFAGTTAIRAEQVDRQIIALGNTAVRHLNDLDLVIVEYFNIIENWVLERR